MRQTVLILFISALFGGCATSGKPIQKVQVEEWISSPPASNLADPTKQMSEVKKFSMLSVGQSSYASHPKGKEPYVTVDGTGAAVTSVILGQDTNQRIYSLSSFKPVILNVTPKAKENFENIEDFSTYSNWVMSVFAAIPAIALGPAIAGSTLAYTAIVASPLTVIKIGAYFSSKMQEEYKAIRENYTRSLMHRVYRSDFDFSNTSPHH